MLGQFEGLIIEFEIKSVVKIGHWNWKSKSAFKQTQMASVFIFAAH